MRFVGSYQQSGALVGARIGAVVGACRCRLSGRWSAGSSVRSWGGAVRVHASEAVGSCGENGWGAVLGRAAAAAAKMRLRVVMVVGACPGAGMKLVNGRLSD
jgi:hypothetical protein